MRRKEEEKLREIQHCFFFPSWEGMREEAM
jgi:hypothetical protein